MILSNSIGEGGTGFQGFGTNNARPSGPVFTPYYAEDSWINPADKDSSITLSFENRRANKSSSGWKSARILNPHGKRKWYWEVVFEDITSTFSAAGFCDDSASLSNYIGSDTHGVGFVSDGSVFHNGAFTPRLPVFANGDVLSIAVDTYERVYWGRLNGGEWVGNGPLASPNSPISGIAIPAGIGIELYPAISLQSVTGQTLVNLRLSDMIYDMPVNFSAWERVENTIQEDAI